MTTEIRETSLSPDGKVYTIDRHQSPWQAWSVTTILDAMPKPFLVNWAAAMVANTALDVWEPELKTIKRNLIEVHEFLSDYVMGDLEAEEAYELAQKQADSLSFGLDYIFGVDSITYKNQRSTPDGMTALLTRGTKSGRDTVRRRLSGAPNAYRDERAEIGKEVHHAIDRYIQGMGEEEVSEMAAPYLQQFWRFLRDWQPEIIGSEMTVYHPDWKYAGTLDMMARIPALSEMHDQPSTAIWVIDHKTGKSVYPTAALQLAAYRWATHYETPEQTRGEDGETMKKPQAQEAAVLHLQEETYNIVPVDSGAEVMSSFRHLMEIFRFTQDREMYVLGEAIGPDMETLSDDSRKD